MNMPIRIVTESGQENAKNVEFNFINMDLMKNHFETFINSTSNKKGNSQSTTSEKQSLQSSSISTSINNENSQIYSETNAIINNHALSFSIDSEWQESTVLSSEMSIIPQIKKMVIEPIVAEDVIVTNYVVSDEIQTNYLEPVKVISSVINELPISQTTLSTETIIVLQSTIEPAVIPTEEVKPVVNNPELIVPETNITQTNETVVKEETNLIATVVGKPVFYSDGTPKILLGSTGDDIIYGTENRDRLLGGSGDDEIYSYGGNDQIAGGSGNDIIYGGDGEDEIRGSSGNDTLFGEAGDDKLSGHVGDDFISGGSGNDYITGYDGNDLLFGDDGNDTLKGEKGSDYIDPGRGNDYVEAGSGNDFVYDTGGQDRIILHEGDDSFRYDIIGNQGFSDFIGADAGFDTLILDVNNEIANTAWFNQAISDFHQKLSTADSITFNFKNYDPTHQFMQFQINNVEDIILNFIEDVPPQPRDEPEPHPLDLLEVKYSGLLNGQGQTVAIFDTGIDYNLNALGGGLGPNYRVVGGHDYIWTDDDDPYSDKHWHGTHVASIIGSSGEKALGWAPEVDFVILRAFDDNGSAWPSSAIYDSVNWLIEHFNDFENPITTINWSNTAGIVQANAEYFYDNNVFFSAAAGNSFNGNIGMSGAAASPFTVGVGSHGSSGTLASKSQRAEGMLAAEGVNVKAYVPLAKRTENGEETVEAHTGTSMAAPQVAGASIVLRELMEIINGESVNQDDIYNVMYETAKLVYDSKTNLTYHNLDMKSAIAAVTPEDDFANDTRIAESIGVIEDAYTLRGFISANYIHDNSYNGKIIGISDYDLDYFTFTASHSGELTLTAEAVGFSTITPNWLTSEINPIHIEENHLTLQVTQSQSYTLGVTSSQAIGHYKITFDYAEVSNQNSSNNNQTDNDSFNTLAWQDIFGQGDNIARIENNISNNNELIPQENTPILDVNDINAELTYLEVLNS